MSYIRKTKDEWQIQGYYDGEWSTECRCEERADANFLLKTYRENCPKTPFRKICARIPLTEEEYKAAKADATKKSLAR